MSFSKAYTGTFHTNPLKIAISCMTYRRNVSPRDPVKFIWTTTTSLLECAGINNAFQLSSNYNASEQAKAFPSVWFGVHPVSRETLAVLRRTKLQTHCKRCHAYWVSAWVLLDWGTVRHSQTKDRLGVYLCMEKSAPTAMHKTRWAG